jgi:hypothetical protein
LPGVQMNERALLPDGFTEMYRLRYVDHSSSPDTESILQDVIGELVLVMQQNEGTEQWVGIWGPLHIETGVYMIELNDAYSAKGIRTACRAIRDALQRRGATGALTAFPQAPHLLGNGLDRVYNTTVALSLSLPDSLIPAWGTEVTRADVPDRVVGRVLDYALSWCSAAGGELQLHAGDVREAVTLQAAPERLRWMYAHVADRVSVLNSQWPSHVRMCTFTEDAHLIAVDGSNSSPPTASASLTVGTDVLLDLADAATYGFALRTTYPVTNIGWLFERSWPLPPDLARSALAKLRSLETAGALDAYPLQYLGPRFPTVRDDPEYLSTELPNGGHILTSRHADDWLRQLVRPDADLLQESRKALEQVLISPSLL